MYWTLQRHIFLKAKVTENGKQEKIPIPRMVHSCPCMCCGPLYSRNHISSKNSFKEFSYEKLTGEIRRFDWYILDWTNQCKSRLPLVAKSAFLQTATAAHTPGPIYETFFCSGSLKPGICGYLWQTALALIGPI